MAFVSRSLLAPITLVLAATVAGCGDGTTGPQQAPAPTLQTIWPNDDGRYWTFHLIRRSWGVFQPESLQLWQHPADVPPVPGFDQIAALLADRAPGSHVRTDSMISHLQFSGDTTTRSGVAAQNLREWYTLNSGGTRVATPSWDQTFLDRLLRARPDLRPRLARLLSTRESSWTSPSQTNFLHGGLWHRTSEFIGDYGNLDNRMWWVFLTSDLRPGAGFRWQMLSGLVNDAYLLGQVRRELTVTTPAGRVERAIEVLYVLDYGVLGVSVENPMGGADSLGVTRAFDYGTVIYAPNVGPVSLYERHWASFGPRAIGGISSAELSLVATGRP